MEITFFVAAVILPVVFYREIVVPRRYGVFLFKSLFFLTANLPGFALMSWHWSQPSTGPYEPGKNPAYEVCIVAMLSGLVSGGIGCMILDFGAPWKELLLDTAKGFAANLALMAYLSWQADMPVTRAHLSFLILQAPGIVCRYIVRLPWDGWASAWWLFTELLGQFSLTSRRPSVHALNASSRDPLVFGNFTKQEL
ncbi:hypothetical protein NLG97_g4103 [Lecanicillium saksenae]|uniref:Uncharacterized protein n=1 Tax=Lecanicillium saksenae TaxID=468837 RepID=A0ACC1QXL6_9HYPO|nr:hypothetical protein NLG97_g4103 [Lecanicillium saksenae]